jgi:hypothetical protein
MTTSAAVPGFLPSTHGFKFTNSFPKGSDIRLDLGPAGRLAVGDASHGVCGGMAFAVRDFFEAGLPIPSDTTPPDAGTPLYEFIVKRLLQSFDVPAGVARYALWMSLPGSDFKLLGFTERGVNYRTIHEAWPQIRADLDSGHPSPLGLVTVHTTDVRRIGKCHQVLAYGYSIDDAEHLTISVYDPNTPQARADDVTIRLPLDPAHAVTIEHNINIAENTLHGFFRSAYAPGTPPQPVG